VATTEPDSLILIVCPAHWLSDEFVLRAKKTYGRIKDAPALVGDAARRVTFEIQSRKATHCAGWPTCAWQSSTRRRCSDELITAVRPMLATNPKAQLVYLSTPKGKRGTYWEVWTNNDPDWQRIHIKFGSCPRITPEFLRASERI
jgi:hypothetical protein